MSEILKPSGLNTRWAMGGDIIDPGVSKYTQGWLTEIPPRQYFNHIDNRQDEAIAHINQHGIAVWDSATEYQGSKSYVTGSDGKVYIAVQTNTNQNPVTDSSETYWANVFKNGYLVFTSSQVWTVPPILQIGLRKANVQVLGGGGGGARTSGLPGPTGGGQGGAAYKLVDLTGVATVSITVGAGGAGGAADPSNGVAGNTSSFGAFCSATGGGGGQLIASGVPGGNGVGGDLNITGGVGQIPLQGSGFLAGGAGGGGSSAIGSTGAGTAPQPGHGGAGRITSAAVNGANGLVVVWW